MSKIISITFTVLCVLMSISMVAQLAHAKSGIDKPTGCRYEARTKGGFFEAKTICIGWGGAGVERAVVDGNTLKVYVDNELAEGLKKGSVHEKYYKKTMVTPIAEAFAWGNRVKTVRVEFLSGGKLLLAAEGSEGSMKLLTKGEEGTVAANCEKLVDGIPKQLFSNRAQDILSSVNGVSSATTLSKKRCDVS